MKQLVEYILLRFLCSTVKAQPVSFSLKVGRFLGISSSRFLKKRVGLAYNNLENAFEDRLTHHERMEIIHDLLGFLGEAFVESVIVTQKDVGENISIANLEHLSEALKLKKRGDYPWSTFRSLGAGQLCPWLSYQRRRNYI